MVLESNTLDVLFVKDGQQGEDGKVLYTWIKYAKDANGTGMTDDPNGAIYIGISYNNESSTESNDPTQYAWTKIQGADGKKGEDAYTIFLENENISFATDKNRNPLSEQAYTSGITIMKGAKPVTDFIIGDIAKTQGIAVAKTDTAIAISVVNGNPLPNDSGEIEIPITVGGTVFKKILTWTCAKKGDQGEQGERGLQGIQGPQGIQGVAGKDGTNGKTAYFHIKYSSVANPTSSSQLTETPSTYIGTYVDFTETDSTDPKKYTWSQFVGSQGPKGEQGIAGVGVDGKTSYLHIAYANSADGKTGFSTSDSTNKSYIGQYTDFTPNDSTDYTKYSWSLIRGKDGTDGVSPTVSVTKNGKTTTITITDKNGTHTQTVKDGTDGTPGQTGKDGKTSYFHVKYSNDGGKTFTSNSGEDTGIYMGSYTDYTETDSTDVKKYNWVKVKGDKGDTGQKGQNAKNLSITPSSQYFKSTDGGKTFAPDTITIKPTIQGEINFGKWQYSIDGGVSFADVVSGQKGLTVSNNVLAVSKDSSLYSDAVTMVTFRAVANDSSFYDTCSIAKIYDVSDIGDGRNLLWNSNFAKTDETINTVTYTTWGLILRGSTYTATIDTSVNHNNFNTLKVIGTKAGDNGGQDLIYRIKGLNLDAVNFTETDVKYTLSFYAKASIACNFSARYSYDSYAKDTNVALSTDWKRYEIQMHPTTTSYQTALIFKMDAASTVWFSEFKLEKGSSATGYSTAPEDVQTAILSTKSEISDVSLKVDKNKQAIEQRVEKTTYQQDLKLVKGDINKANEGLNKWRYEIYPKSLFASEYQGKSTMDVFAKNTNLTPSQSVLINDTDLSIAWNYAENYIGYALTFTKFSAAKSVAITFAHDDGAHIYLNGKLIGGSDAYNRNGESLTLGFVKGWNCIEVVVNEGGSTEGFTLGTTISALSECQLMNCYYGTPVARQSHITNQLVENTTNIKGISTKVSKVTSVIGEDGKNFTDFKNDYSDFKQTMNGFKTTVGQTYVTKDDFDDLQIGGRNLLLYSANLKNGYYTNIYDTADETFKGCSVFKVNHAWNGIRPYFNKHITERNVIKAGDVLTYSVYAKTDDTKEIDIMMFNRTMDSDSDQGAIRGNQGELKLSNDWKLYSVTFKVTESMLSVDKGLSWFGYELCNNTSSGKYVYFACPKLENSNKPTDWTPAPEDVNGKIVNVETIANQTANKFEWIVKGGDKSSSMVLTDDFLNIVANNINLTGKVTFNSLSSDAKNEIGKVAQSKVDDLQIGGRNLLVQKNITEGYLSTDGKGSFVGSGGGDQTSDWIDVSGNKYITVTLYEDFTNTNNSGRYCEYDADKNCINTVVYNPRQKSSIIIELKSNTKYIRVTAIECKTRRYKIEAGNKPTDWTPAPEDVSKDATDKSNQALSDAKKYSESAVNWVNSNGTNTNNLRDMVLKWTNNAVSTNTYIQGGWIATNTITADKIAIGDFTNYVEDPTFERGIYKDDKNFAIDSSIFYTGSKSLKMKSGTSGYAEYSLNDYKNFPVTSGEKIYVEWYGYRNGANQIVGINIEIMNETGESIVHDIPGYTSMPPTATDKTWIKYSHVATVTSNGFASISFKKRENGTLSGDWYVDNVIVRRMASGELIVDGAITADKIATDAIKSRNYISSGGTQGSFLNMSDGSFTAPNLSWDLNGNLIAKNANLSGEITATNGSIGKYKITDQWLITGSGSTATGIGGNQAFWAGAEDSNSAPFRVGYDGKLYANGATISGDITATTGKIGDLTLKDGILTGTGSYSEPYTEDDDGTVTSTITTNYITKLFGKGLTIDSTVKYSDEDDVYSYKVSVLPDEISFTDGEEIGMLGAGGLQILQVNDNSDSYSSEANEVSLSSGASNFYYTTHVNQTTDKYLHVCFSADGASFMASQGDKFNSFDIGYSSAKYSGNFAANKFVYTGNSLNYVECLEANDTTNVYFHSSGYYSFRVNNEGNWSNETQSVYITERGISVPGKIGLYSQEMSNYVARYYVAGSTKSTAIGNNSYQTRIYGSSVWANKAVSTSDVRLKQDFQSLDKFEDLYMQLQPVSFKYIDGYDKSEDRYFGLKAQPTEQLFEDMGENPDDYAMFNKFGIDHEDIKERIGYDVDFDEEHGLDYTNLITLNTHMVQKTRRELAELQKENAELKDMLKTIVEKINM